jgi:hypothetical protein
MPRLRRINRKESKTHLAAKRRLAGWLRQAIIGGQWGLTPACRVWVEFPLCFEGDCVLYWHHLRRYRFRAPTTAELIADGYYAPLRLDLAVTTPRQVVAGFEVCHAFPVTPVKGRILRGLPFPTIELRAAWILEQRAVPLDWTDGLVYVYGQA